MILKAKHHFFLYPFFHWYSLRNIRRDFHSVEITGSYQDRGLPLLVISNHISWWDGFWISYLDQKVLHKRFHFMMLEENLRKHWYFNYTGGYSVKKNSRSVIESIQYTAELLSNPENMVFIFPQGKIHSMHQHKTEFQKGIERIIQSLHSKIQILFLINMVDYFSNRKPTLFMYISEFPGERFSTEDLQESFNQFYSDCIDTQINRKG